MFSTVCSVLVQKSKTVLIRLGVERGYHLVHDMSRSVHSQDAFAAMAGCELPDSICCRDQADMSMYLQWVCTDGRAQRQGIGLTEFVRKCVRAY